MAEVFFEVETCDVDPKTLSMQRHSSIVGKPDPATFSDPPTCPLFARVSTCDLFHTVATCEDMFQKVDLHLANIGRVAVIDRGFRVPICPCAMASESNS